MSATETIGQHPVIRAEETRLLVKLCGELIGKWDHACEAFPPIPTQQAEIFAFGLRELAERVERAGGKP